MMVSTSPAPLRRKAAARSYSAEVKQATPCSKLGNSITTKRWNLCGPSMIRWRPPRARTLPPYLAMIAGTRSVYFLYSTGSLIFERATQYAGIVLFPFTDGFKSLRGAARGDNLVGSATGEFGHMIELEREGAGARGCRADFDDQVADLGLRHFSADYVPAIPAFARIEAQNLPAPA